jgi:hypothetical protein
LRQRAHVAARQVAVAADRGEAFTLAIISSASSSLTGAMRTSVSR